MLYRLGSGGGHLHLRTAKQHRHQRQALQIRQPVSALTYAIILLPACKLGLYRRAVWHAAPWIIALSALCGTASYLCYYKALGKLGARKTMLISVIACAAHMIFYTFVTPGANPQSLIFMYIAGGLASFAITFGTHAVCSSVIAEWFVEKRAQVTGMVLSGAGLGAAAWVFLAGQLFKVTDYKNCYRIFSCLVLVIGLLAVLLLIKSPEQMGQKPLGWEKAAAGETEELPGVSYKEAVKSGSFKVLILALLFLR